MRAKNAGWIGVLVFALASSAYASIEAGRVQFVIGDARALGADGAERTLTKGAAVLEGDTIVTGASASMQLRMADKAVIAVRPNSRLQIDEYRFQGREDGSENAVLHLIKGSFRSITGLIGKANKENYKVITDTANIGIRGTDHEPVYLLPPSASETAAGAPGTYDKVNTGLTYLATAAGRLNLSPNQVGFASSQPGSTPVQLDGVPGFMRSTPSMSEGRGASGAEQPVRVAAPGADSPYAAEPWFHGQTTAYEHDPRVVTRQQTADGSVDFTGSSSSSSFAGGTERVAGVYGDLTGGVARNGAFTAVRTPAENFLAGSSGALAATDPASKLIYTRGPAPMVVNGSGSFDDGSTTVFVNWGVYGTGAAVNGHTVKDQFTGGPGREPDYMQVMGALETPAAILSGLSGTYSNMVASTRIIAESGVPGGSVTSANIVLSNGTLENYSVGATDAMSRTWTGNYSGSVTLATFAASGVALNGTGPAGAAATGQANGQPVGPTGQGVVSSFALQSGAAAITGSFAVKQ